MKKIIILIFAIVILSINCSIDDNPVAPPLEPAPQQYTVKVIVNPPTAFRTTDTWNAWVNPVELQFQSTFIIEHPGEGDSHKAHHGELELGTETLEGMNIQLIADHAGDIFHPQTSGGHGHEAEAAGMEFEKEHGVEGDFMLMLHLFDNFSGHSPNGGINVPYSKVHIAAKEEMSGVETEISLMPVLTAHGFRYAANAELPAGEYDLHIEAEAPLLAREEGFQLKWNDHMESEIHGFEIGNSITSGTIGTQTIDGLQFKLRSSSVSKFGALGTGALPLNGNENIQFSLSITDESFVPEQQSIFYCSVKVTIINNSTGITSEKFLYPYFGSDGFHYAANFKLPKNHSIMNEGDGHDDDH